ncbi:cytochrome P450 CYP52T1 [Cercophora scortea]|uniref:Cytochrome P450 CYP52T1 n=1 Tax=Cercophora scortea TaxID=314031 RepID=A0AAE0MB47_9PEZI|nr:cytochrome P450 CYP52T1 [Cercophora scortea]
MMTFLDSTLIPPLLILIATLLWVRKLYRDHQFQQFALQHDCSPPPHAASRLPWGLDRTWQMVRLTNADADVMETVFQPGFARFGWTFSSTGLLGERHLFTADPANARAMFSTQFDDFLAGADRIDNVGFVVGRCIFTVDGPFWERSRALFRPHFARAEINDLEATERAVRDLFLAVDAAGDDDEDARWTQVIDLQKLFLRFTLDTGTEFFFGANVKSQLAAIPGNKNAEIALDETTRLAADSAGDDGLTFTEAYSLAFKEIARRARLSNLSWLADFFPSDGPRAVRYLERFIDRLVEDAQLQNKLNFNNSTSAETGEKKPSFLQALAQTTPDPIEVRDQAHFMLAASRDTTASLLSWLFLLLAKHPEQLTRLRAAITADFGTDTDTVTNITAQALKKCTYLQWAMAEALRLHPPAALNGRIAARDTTLPTGGGPDSTRPVAIRKGTKVTLVPYAMHRRRDLFGDDAAEFRPERWEGRKVDWGYVPFSGGPRACLGKEYALAEAGYLTVRLLQRYDRVEPVDDLTSIPQKVTVTLQPSKGVNVRLRRAAV